MIKFFRSIRKKLAAENKFMAYSRYAIGEIILVVIGILIALQVSNWNQNRKNNEQAQKILLSLREDFKTNIININHTADRVNTMCNYTSKFITAIDRDSTSINPDSLGNYVTVGASSWWGLKTVSNTYDAISGAGNINLIQNEKLQKLLAEFYATTQSGFEDGNNLEQLALKISEETSSETYILWPKRDFREYPIISTKSEKEKQDAVISLLQKKDIMGLLLFKNVLEINQKYYLQQLLNLSKDILTEIDKELEF